MKKKDELDNDNKEKLQEAARRLGIPEEEVLSKVPEGIWIAYIFNPKALGGHLKRMELDMPQAEVLKKQLADDPWGSIFGFFNKTQEKSSQQQDGSKKSDEVSNLSTETISIRPLETPSTASCQESTRGWSNDNKGRLKTLAELSNKSEGEVLNEISQDLGEALSNPEELANYLRVMIESLTINDSCTNNNPLDDVAAGSSHEMSNVASCQGCDLTGKNLPFNEDLD